ncbi:MAG: DNA adenine methylase [Micropruina sp.]|uniref:DNA adenine methylase n=1 Tax=Micropruina sp. TaxID=2737536 RepID=UPI0039E21770
MIKYLGSKRALAGVLGTLAQGAEARTAVDLFTGTTRVAQEFKRRGLLVTAVDLASYSEVLARCYIATDGAAVDGAELDELIAALNALPGRRGYVTETFCENARFFQPHNGQRIDAIREHLVGLAGHPLYPVLLTALMEAADRVDNTTGQHMAYLKTWAPRSANQLRLRTPALLPGTGTVRRGDALEVARTMPPADLAYLDPPYNQHRYFSYYHIWETLVRWDAPDHYGIACKRADARAEANASPFNSRRRMPDALAAVIGAVDAEVVMVSYNDEAWVTPEQIVGWLRDAGHPAVELLAFDSRRYIGARIGIYNHLGEKVGRVSHTRNTEYVFVAGDTDRVGAALAALADRDPVGVR